MGYLEWSNEIRIVSISGQKVGWRNVLLIQIWWNPEIDQKGQNYDTFFVKFETTPWMVPHCYSYTLKVTIDKGQSET